MAALEVMPCLDSPERGETLRLVLDIDRGQATRLGRSAVEAAESGRYVDPSGAVVDWQAAVQHACSLRRSLPPGFELPHPPMTGPVCTRVQVSNETTLGAALRLTNAGSRPLALNFANGKNPGGGFLSGSRAQEETLCRASALYQTLSGDPMYAAHARRPLPDSTTWSILSPRVPVFRDDAGQPLPAPWLLDVLTCAAPYAPALDHQEAARLLAERILHVLSIARAFHYDTLVLGAWGCGAFGNDAGRTARDFRQALTGTFAGVFREVVFAIVDWSPERRFLGPFREVFAAEQQAV